MDPSVFTEPKTGKLVKISSLTGEAHAFVPTLLPPDWRWPERLWPALRDAHAALARLDGTGKHLPSRDLLLRPLQEREAKLSSRLEGTVTESEQQMLFNIEPRVPKSEDDPANAFREVFNYAQALRLRLDTRDEAPLSGVLIRQLHTVLMDGVRGSDSEPGRFRDIQVQIGRPARFVPSPPEFLAELLEGLETYIRTPGSSFDPLVNAFLVHYQFETIHPFRDGNGRVGRLLLAIMIAEWCQLSDQWLYMSAYFDRNKDAYQDHLFSVSAVGAWEVWIEFCLQGVIEEATETVARCDRLVALSRSYHDMVQRLGGSARLSGVVDALFETPVVRVPYIAEKFSVTYPTADADIEKLVGAGILKQSDRHSRKVFFAPDILAVMFEGTE